MFCSVSLISPNFDVESIIFPNFGLGPFPKIAGKCPGFSLTYLKPEDWCSRMAAQIKCCNGDSK